MEKQEQNNPGNPPPYNGPNPATNQQGTQMQGQPMQTGYGQPMQAGYGQPMQMGYGQPMIQMQPVIIQAAPALDRNPMNMNCPKCHANVTTTITLKVGKRGWRLFSLMCFIGFWCGCCLLPWCMDSMKDVHHYCPQCKGYIGVASH